jgi:hypothetical protein
MPTSKGVQCKRCRTLCKEFAVKVVPLLSVAIVLATPAPPASAAALQLGCTVNGSGGVTIVNDSGVEVPAGTKIKWTVASPHAAGKVTLGQPLAVGMAISLSDALIVAPPKGTPCTAVALGV